MPAGSAWMDRIRINERQHLGFHYALSDFIAL
jgi:hypothetical protein